MSVADEIRKLAELKEEGLLTEAEFEAEKKAALFRSADKESAGDDSSAANEDEKKHGKGKAAVSVVVIIIMVVIVLILTVDNSPQAKEKQQARSAISLCWKDYEKRSNSGEMRLFIARVCEGLEADFLKKYRHRP